MRRRIYDRYVLPYVIDLACGVKPVKRVLRPNGRLLFCEHGLAPEASVQKWQRRLTPIWRPLAGGCHLDRDIPALLREGGLRVAELVETMYLPGPRPLTYNYWGAAVPE